MIEVYGDGIRTQSAVEVPTGQPSENTDSGMTAQSPAGGRNEHPKALRQRRFMILSALVALDTFVLGGLAALLLVNQLLGNQLSIYAPHSMDAASTILDFMDDLIPYYVAYSGTLVALILITVSAWVWLMTESRALRYGMALLILILVVVGAWTLLLHSTGAPPVPPLTPTPIG